MLLIGLVFFWFVFFSFPALESVATDSKYARGRDQIDLQTQVIPGLRTWCEDMAESPGEF